MRILIPTLPGSQCLRLCLESYKLLSPEVPITVVVGGKADPKDAYNQVNGLKVDVIELGENKGFPGNVNEGLRRIDDDIVILSNDDVIMHTPNWPDIIREDFQPQSSPRWQRIAAVGATSNYVINLQLENMPGPPRQFLDVLSFFWIAITREAFDDVGLLDEDFGFGLSDDVEWTHRARMKDWQLLLDRRLHLWHWGSQTIRRVTDLGQTYYKNKAIYHQKMAPVLKAKEDTERAAAVRERDEEVGKTRALRTVKPSPNGKPQFTMNDVCIGIKTFMRPECLFPMLDSAKKHYPDVPIVVVDDSAQTVLEETERRIAEYPGVRHVAMPYDSGASAGRNRFVQEADRALVLNCDDDFIFVDFTALEELVNLINETGCDIAGASALPFSEDGLVQKYQPHGFRHHCGWFEKTGKHLHIDIRQRPYTGPVQSHMTSHFFLGRRERVQAAGWDDRLKINDHLSFFLRCWKAGLKVMYSPDCVIEHRQIMSQEYVQFRKRDHDLARVWMEAHDVQSFQFDYS